VGYRNVREADSFIIIFTREFGLIYAFARSVRMLKSKLRFSLQTFSFINVSLVRGRDMWRITNAEEIMAAKNYASDSAKLRLASRIFLLLRRLVHGEERNEGLFECLRGGIFFLDKEDFAPTDLASFEHLFVLRLLHRLGYGSTERVPALAALAPASDWRRESLAEVRHARHEALAAINEALEATHL
jgi:DNA repair protein RecO